MQNLKFAAYSFVWRIGFYWVFAIVFVKTVWQKMTNKLHSTSVVIGVAINNKTIEEPFSDYFQVWPVFKQWPEIMQI